MAEIYISLAEIVDILLANKLLTDQLSQIEIDDNMISFRYKTGHAFPAHVDISAQFLKFEKGVAELAINTSWLVEKVLKHSGIFKQDFIQLAGSRISVDLDFLIKNKELGIMLEKVEFINHRFQIIFYTTK